MMQKIAIVLSFLTLLGTASADAEPNLTLLKNVLGDRQPDSVAPAAAAGWYEVVFDTQIFYLSEDGRYVMQGDIINLQTRENLTEAKRDGQRAAAIDALDEQQMIVFAPDQPPAHTVTVFTDIDCGYCRKMHQEMQTYLDRGIRFRYLAFPRAGLMSESYDKAVSAWCADDPRKAMTLAKRGEAIEEKTCDNPVTEHYELGVALGVRGTPSIVTANGQMIPGYLPADRLLQTISQ